MPELLDPRSLSKGKRFFSVGGKPAVVTMSEDGGVSIRVPSGSGAVDAWDLSTKGEPISLDEFLKLWSSFLKKRSTLHLD